ncbi:MAG: hypothetical protein AAF943_03735 [Pseudomonadota bacterium]
MIRFFILLGAGVALSACQPAVPDSGRGVGFDDPTVVERRAREAALTGQNVVTPVLVTAPQNPPPFVNAPAPISTAAARPAPAPGSAEETAAETARVLAATRPGGSAPTQASPANPAPPVLNSTGISNENNFEAVSGQRSIESDAARIASNSAQYQVVQPEALPDRSSSSSPNIVAFALQTRHAVGTKVYRRGFTREARFERACAGFPSADQAQIAFLSSGGPDRDRAGMDPDGDGFACSWDPTPFRRAAQAG